MGALCGTWVPGGGGGLSIVLCPLLHLSGLLGMAIALVLLAYLRVSGIGDDGDGGGARRVACRSSPRGRPSWSSSLPCGYAAPILMKGSWLDSPTPEAVTYQLPVEDPVRVTGGPLNA